MKITCTQENLSQGLSLVSHVASKHANLPILGNVLVRTDDKLIKLAATNLELAVTATVRGRVETPGEYTVPAKLFADYVSSLSGDKVDVDLQNESLQVRGGTSKTKIKGQPASEFPLIPSIDRSSAPAYRVDAADFKKALGRVLFSASPNEARPEISGVFFQFVPAGAGGGTLTLAATDSYRLSEASVPLHESPGATERSVIVPARTLAEVGRMLGVGVKSAEEAPATVEIIPTDNQILFSYGSVEIISRLIEGQYPNYRAVIPERGKTNVTMSRAKLLGAVRAASLFSRSGLFDVHLTVGKGGVVISAADAQTGENQTELPAEVSGDENTAVLNHRYLAEGLSVIDHDEIALQMIDSVNPCVFTPKEQPAGSRYLYVVMPIKQ